MGYAIARKAALRGANVILVSGPVNLSPPCGVELVNVDSARQMQEAVMSRIGRCDVVIKAAAVADYRPQERKEGKIKKQADSLSIELTRNPDILKELGQLEKRPLLVGFAAETDHLESYAARKLTEKNLDMIVANDVSQTDAGFHSRNNRALMLFRDGRRVELDLMPKDEMASRILDSVQAELVCRNV
jgi:phosphopantothenoylcysteine decarboxylase / phosphopantothenate---cysteine ligase